MYDIGNVIEWARIATSANPNRVFLPPGSEVRVGYTGPRIHLIAVGHVKVGPGQRPATDWPALSYTVVADTMVPGLKWLKAAMPDTPTLVRVRLQEGRSTWDIFTLLAPVERQLFEKPLRDPKSSSPYKRAARLHVTSEGYLNNRRCRQIATNVCQFDELALLGLQLGLFVLRESGGRAKETLRIIGAAKDRQSLKDVLPAQLHRLAILPAKEFRMAIGVARCFLSFRRDVQIV